MRDWDDDLDAVLDVDDVDELDDLDEIEDGEEDDFDDLEALEPYGTIAELGDAFREVLHDDYAALSPVETDEALLEVFESLSPAESFNFGKLLSGAQKGALSVVSDPSLRQIAGASLPIATGALGTVVAPGIGTAVGTSLGTVAGQALAGRRPASPAAAAAPSAAAASPTSPVAAAVFAAPPGATGVVTPLAASGEPLGAPATRVALTTALPTMQKAFLAAALGPVGATVVDGFKVADLLKEYATMATEAAEEAEDLAYPVEGRPGLPIDADGEPGAELGDAADRDRLLYEELLDAEEQDLADVAGLL